MNADPLTEEKKKQLNILYAQLAGMWNGLKTESSDEQIVNGPLELYINTVDQLLDITGLDYDGFLPHFTENDQGKKECRVRDLKTQAGALLERLNVEYFPEKVSIFVAQSEAASTAIYQTFSQNVEVSVEVLTNLADHLSDKSSEFDENSNERKFIERVKAGLSGVKSYAALLTLIFNSAHSVGLSIDALRNIFS